MVEGGVACYHNHQTIRVGHVVSRVIQTKATKWCEYETPLMVLGTLETTHTTMTLRARCGNFLDGNQRSRGARAVHS